MTQNTEPEYLFTIASRFGRSDNPDDVEAVLFADGHIGWPEHAYALRQVQYFRDEAEAQRVADALGPHRRDARVSLSRHSALADYVLYHGSPVR